MKAVREAFSTGLIEYEDIWIELIRDRNAIAHTYDKKHADKLYEKLPDYLNQLQKLLKAMDNTPSY